MRHRVRDRSSVASANPFFELDRRRGAASPVWSSSACTSNGFRVACVTLTAIAAIVPRLAASHSTSSAVSSAHRVSAAHDGEPTDADRARVAAIDLVRTSAAERAALDEIDARLPASRELTDLMLSRLADPTRSAPAGRLDFRMVVIRRLERVEGDPRVAAQLVALAEDALAADRPTDARRACERARARLASSGDSDSLRARLERIDRALASGGRRAVEPVIVLDGDRVATVAIAGANEADDERDSTGALIVRTTLFALVVAGVVFAWMRRHGLLGTR